ncbi:MAG: DNA methyltransferase, partial [Candidatus Hydrogenedentales bacterium]
MAKDPELIAHQEWLGYVQPVGLVVSPPALLAAQAYVNKNIIPEHQRFLECVESVTINGGEDTALAVTDLSGLLQRVFEWQSADLINDGSLDSLEVVLTEYGETLRPAYAVKEIEPDDAQANPWLMLVQTVSTGADLDDVLETDDHRWQASPQAKLERLLRETKVPIGLLFNGTHLRLVYAPRGETSGFLTFPVQAMAQVDGRPIFAALHMLLSAERLFTLPRKQRLPYLLSESRKYQNLVSTQLAEQVLNALYELLRGFQAADDLKRGELLRLVLREEPNHVYAGLLNVLLRLVFVLYAEDRGLMPADSVYGNHYSINGLFERLRSDASRFPDTMDQRYGAWAQLLALFRLIHDGASHGNTFKLPPRQGHLFNPDRYPFLEGRPYGSVRQIHEIVEPPMVSDGVVFRVLRDLLILDGERISYRTLDVEQIGSVYETVMGFTLEVAQGRSIALKPTKPHGAPYTINLDALLEEKPANRAKWVKDIADQTVTGEALKALQAAKSVEDLEAALRLGKRVSSTSPRIVTPGAMVLQPSDERRRSGSHYTPRSLTEPIVRTTLRPVLEQLGDKPTPEQILDLKVCDPAMGSGAFLVEADRQLADELVKAWHNHDCVPAIPPDEDEVLLARRLVAQRCLYGVDKNPMAVDLAKLSLWLATLAKDHAFTFVDHALRCGDSLVGLTRKQISAFNWGQAPQLPSVVQFLTSRIASATKARREITDGGDFMLPAVKTQRLKLADDALQPVRLAGNICIAAFFSETKNNKREQARGELAREFGKWIEKTDAEALKRLLVAVDTLTETQGVTPFHWEIEFHEVFNRDAPGFDAIVGNPPFLWGNRISSVFGGTYCSWLSTTNPASNGNADFVVYFLRRALQVMRPRGCFGLVTTNSISETDTRSGGLDYIVSQGNSIYAAITDFRWPGQAGVRVSIVHVSKHGQAETCSLDGIQVEGIGPDLRQVCLNGTKAERIVKLTANTARAFKGVDFGGSGFLLSEDEY